MPVKRKLRSNTPGRPRRLAKIRFRRGSAINVTRAEFDAVVKLLNEHREAIDELRRDLYSTCRDLAPQVEKNRRSLETQFTRIAQIQQQIDQIRSKDGR